MAGRPKRAELVKAVAAAGGEDALISRVESGETIAAIAGTLGVSRPMLSTYLNRNADAKERITRAREASAHALVEEALAIADSATHDDDRAKRLQVSMRQWLAGKFNRERYGDGPMVAVSVQTENLLLSSLLRQPPTKPAALDQPQDVVVQPVDNDSEPVSD